MFETDKLRQELEKKIVEFQLIKGKLQSCEKACMSICANLEKY